MWGVFHNTGLVFANKVVFSIVVIYPGAHVSEPPEIQHQLIETNEVPKIPKAVLIIASEHIAA
jgi:hypothetical protein